MKWNETVNNGYSRFLGEVILSRFVVGFAFFSYFWNRICYVILWRFDDVWSEEYWSQ